MSSLASRIEELLGRRSSLASPGLVETEVPGVHLFRIAQASPRAPLLYQPGILVIAQGHKVVYLGDRVFGYDRETFLVLGVPVPLECETHASPEDPLLGLRIDLDLGVLHELVGKLGDEPGHGPERFEPHSGIEPAALDEAMSGAVLRLLDCLGDPTDARVLGPAAVQETLYRVLRGEKGGVLYNLTQHHTPYAAVSRSLHRIHREYGRSMSVNEMAEESAMSLSTFHRAFKRVTGASPLQYLKKIRLEKARGLLVNQQLPVSTAAFRVGYESPSQFSREYKRYFKTSPSEDLVDALDPAV